MKTNRIILLLITFLMVFGCTKDIEFNGKVVEPFLILDGHLTPDSIVKVRVNKSHFTFKNQDSKQLAINNATVKLYVNDKFIQNMQSIGDEGFYFSHYKPKADETIKITVDVNGIQSIEAKTTIPQAPLFQIKDTTERYYESEMNRYGVGVYQEESNFKNPNYNTDTITQQLRKSTKAHFVLSDLPNDHYYFYKSFTIAYLLENNEQTSQMDTIWRKGQYPHSYNLKDVIPSIHPENIEDAFYFNEDNKNETVDEINIFSDKMVDKSKVDMYFDFDVLIGAIEYVNNKKIGIKYFGSKRQEIQEIRLASMSKDLFLFVKSLEKAQNTNGSPFAEPVPIYSNVKNGAGILGSYNTTTHIIKTVNR